MALIAVAQWRPGKAAMKPTEKEAGVFTYRSGGVAAVTALALMLASAPSAQSAIVPSSSTNTSRLASVPHALGTTVSAAKLSGLKDYSATLDDNGYITKYRVHSPSDWEDFASKRTPLSVQVNGFAYSLVPVIKGTTVTVSWKKIGPAQDYSAAVPYVGYARGFFALTHVAGTRLVRGSSCRQAGVKGHWWGFAAAARGAVFPHVIACVADRSGWLLDYGFATLTSGGAPVGFRMSFEITGVNNVGFIPVPHG